MELPELFAPAELADMIAPNIDLNLYHIKYQHSCETKIFTMCDPLSNQPRCLIIINNKRISIAECDKNDYTSQTELIRITKDEYCSDIFHVANCTKSKAHAILDLIEKIKKFINEKVMKNRIETKEDIKEEKNMSNAIKFDQVITVHDMETVINRWVEKYNKGHINCVHDGNIIWWISCFNDGLNDIGIEICPYGYVITRRLSDTKERCNNLFTITASGARLVDFSTRITLDNSICVLDGMLRDLVEKRTEVDHDVTGFSVKDMKHIQFNETKKVTTVIFKDGTRTMSRTCENDTFDPEVGLAMCIMKKLYGTRTNYKRVVAAAMKNNEKHNKRIKEKADKKQKNQQAKIDHMKAQAESYME